METYETLKANHANIDYISKHSITPDDLEHVNHTIHIIEQSRNWLSPIFGDQIICTSPDKFEDYVYPSGHLDSPIDREYASICVQPSGAPFVFHDGEKLTRFSCSGGYWIAEQEVKMYVYKGETEKLFCQWGHCGMAHSGAIYFHAMINEWLLVKENLN